MSIVPRTFVGGKCPTCGTTFAPESMHPFDIEVREQFKKRRSKAAKKGWRKRRQGKK
jgi:rRNA maturation protein Nop10